MSNLRYRLLGISDENTGAIYQINRAEMVIGSGADADIKLDHESVSSTHCILKQLQDTLTVGDLHSRTGTKIDNKRIDEETVLKSGDLLTVGSLTFRVAAETFKEKMFSSSVQKKQGVKSFFPNMTGIFRRKIQPSYKRASLISMVLLVVLSWIMLVYPLYNSFRAQLDVSEVERGTALLKTLAAANTSAMQRGEQAMIDTSMVSMEPGVGLALVLTNKGVVWAPKSLLGKTANDVYGKKATRAEKLIIQKRDDGRLDLAIPIKVYNFKDGGFTKLGVARIIYDPNFSESGGRINWFVLLGLTSFAYFVVAMILAIRLNRIVGRDIDQFRDDCEEFIRSDNYVLEERYSPEFNRLILTINRMLRKVEHQQVSDDQKPATDTRDIFHHLVHFLDQGALLIDRNNRVMASNAKALEILGLQAEEVANRKLIEIQCSHPFYTDFLEFVLTTDSSGLQQRGIIPMKDNDNGKELNVVTIPVTENQLLLLMSFSK